MGKFGSKRTPVQVKSPVRAAGRETRTFEGGVAYERDAKSDLFLLAATNMVGEETFYERAQDRDERFVKLVHTVTREDPKWVERFIPYLRNEMLMRSASIVVACEYVAAGGPNVSAVIDSACQRADEPAEILGYCWKTFGKGSHAGINRGLAAAAQRLYTQRAALKYDGTDRAIRMGDVIELAHPSPVTDEQRWLFAYLLDVRHHPEAVRVNVPLNTLVSKHRSMMAIPTDERRRALRSGLNLSEAGVTWERLSSWLNGPMDAEAWESVIPAMGYMALLRNLRNFDQAGISAPMAQRVIDKLSNPEEVARSRQLPFRFFSAYKATMNLRWAPALETAMGHSMRNVPPLRGRTLVVVDVSGSMSATISGKSSVARYEVGAVFASAVFAATNGAADLVAFGTNSAQLSLPRGASPMRVADELARSNAMYGLGHGTYIFDAIRRHYAGHDRVVVFTDEQGHDTTHSGLNDIPLVYTWNLAGYAPSMTRAGASGRHTFGGFSDAAFRMLPMIEAGRSSDWPF